VAIAFDGGRPDSSRDGHAGQRFTSKSARYSLQPSLLTAKYIGPSAASRETAPGQFIAENARIAEIESQELSRKAADAAITAADLDPRLVKESFAQLMAEGPAVLEYCYGRLFAANPEIRSIFPMTMTVLRERVLTALERLIWSLDNEPRLCELLGQLGREHRRFGVTERHYDAFFAALRDTARHFLGPAWTAQTSDAWQAALAFFSSTMRRAADREAKVTPRWWIAEIVARELRSPGVGVLKLRPSEPLLYQPGQYVPVQVIRWPRTWRPFSIANSPRPDGLLTLHVRAVPGGLVSNALVYHSQEGDYVLLGAAAGGMALTDSDRDLLCVAGGTGLAPIKALIEQALARPAAGRRRKITLFFGARQHFDLYDLDDLQLLESACPSLRVLPVLSDEPGFGGLTGLLPDVIGARGPFKDADAYICGPAAMVRQTAAILAASIPAAQIHHDPLA
jgi:NAD(P)H-flavin reductase/hemoglobin-like flavoprotein